MPLQTVLDHLGLAAVIAAGRDREHQFIMPSNGGGGEVALRPVSIDATAENVFFAAGFEHLAVDGAAVGGGIYEGGSLDVVFRKGADGVGDPVLLNQFGYLVGDFWADGGHPDLGLK